MTSHTLPEGTILSGRYLLGAVRKSSDAGIAYTAFDRKLRIPAEVYEYYPTDCAIRQQNGGIAAKPGMETIYRDKCRRLRDKGNLCLHQPESDVYDVLSVNGTLYFIHAVSSEKAADFYAYGADDDKDPTIPAGAAMPQGDISVPAAQPAEPEDDEKTRTVRGLFLHADPATDAPTVTDSSNDAPTAHFSADALDTPEEAPHAEDADPAANTVEIPACVSGKSAKGNAAAPPLSPEDTIAVLIRNKNASERAMKQKSAGGSAKTTDDPQAAKRHESAKKDAASPRASDAEETVDEPSGTNLKLLVAILVGGLILLLLCCTIFLLSLSRITDGNTRNGSVLGVPLSEVSDVTDAAVRVVGRTFDQNYAAGMIVAETANGNGFDVTVNGEIPTYAVPDFVGMTESGAQSLFAKTPYQNSTGFVTGNLQRTYVDTTEYPDGMVFEQSPAAGTERGAADISLKIARNSEKSDKSAAVPSLIGKPYSRTAGDFACLITDRIYSDTAPAGEIVAQYPTAGEKIAGGVCYVVVSLGAEKTSVPDVTYMTLSEAENALYEKGLSFTVRYELHSGIAEGLVAIQTPAAGSTADYGETVALSVSGDGEWTAGATFCTAAATFSLSPGEQVTPEWEGISESGSITFHSSDPHTVAISDTGEVMALRSGHAVVTASYGGSTAALPFTVTYPTREPIRAESMCGEKLSLSGLTEGGTYVWSVRAGDATLTGDNLVGNTPGECVVSGENADGTIVLLRITLTEAEKEKAYVTIPKKSITTEADTKKLLTGKGLTCTVETEYSQTIAKGRVSKIRYTGYSDADSYHFTEGSRVTLIVSLGKPSVTSIRIDKKPAKLTYSVGDKLNVSGMIVMATYADGTEQAIASGYATEYDFSKAGRQTVAISYEGRKASFAVEVVDTTAQKATIKTLPQKTTYAPGDTLDTTGLSVEVTYGNGTKKVFQSGFSVKADLTKTGNVTVQVTVEGLSVQYTVKVEEKKVRSLDLAKLPNKTDYVVGESLNTTGMQLRANYTDGSTTTITSGWSTSCDLTKEGASTVTVTYGGKTVTFAVTVRARETETKEERTLLSLSVLTMPQKTEYTVGESFDPTGLVLLATYSDGSTKKLTDGFSASYDFRTVGPTTVRFQFEQKSVEIDVTVRAAGSGLRLSAETLSIAVGKSAELTIDVSNASEDIRYTVEGAHRVDIAQTKNGLQITGVHPGKCVLTFTCGADTAICTITVTDDTQTGNTIGPLAYSTPIINQTSISFMPTLVFTNAEKTDAAVSFTATIRFDPGSISCADTGSSLPGVTASFDGADTITITGSITVPAEGSLTVAYILFLGTDTEAFAVTVS